MSDLEILIVGWDVRDIGRIVKTKQDTVSQSLMSILDPPPAADAFRAFYEIFDRSS